jgi:hypothetical protein
MKHSEPAQHTLPSRKPPKPLMCLDRGEAKQAALELAQAVVLDEAKNSTIH